jgi:hypothetical protein
MCFSDVLMFQTQNPRDDLNVSSRRFPPQPPTHPVGNRTTREAGLLASGSIAFARLPKALRPQWHLDDRSPVTVAGTAAVSNRIPFNPFREPRANLNANAGWIGGQIFHCAVHTKTRGRGDENFTRHHDANAFPPICPRTFVALWMSHGVDHFAAYRIARKVRHKSASNAFCGAELCGRHDGGVRSKGSTCQEFLDFDAKRIVVRRFSGIARFRARHFLSRVRTFTNREARPGAQARLRCIKRTPKMRTDLGA